MKKFFKFSKSNTGAVEAPTENTQGADEAPTETTTTAIELPQGIRERAAQERAQAQAAAEAAAAEASRIEREKAARAERERAEAFLALGEIAEQVADLARTQLGASGEVSVETFEAHGLRRTRYGTGSGETVVTGTVREDGLVLSFQVKARHIAGDEHGRGDWRSPSFTFSLNGRVVSSASDIEEVSMA